MRFRSMVATIALLASACGGGGDGGDGAVSTATSGPDAVEAVDGTAPPSSPPATEAPPPVADVEALADAVEIVSPAGTTGVDRGDTSPAAAGDRIRTNSLGFAEIRYHEGALTRIDGDSDFEIVELGDDAGGSVRTRLNAGRTWNRVERVAGAEQAFEVQTSVAAATVRGTAFVVWCFGPGRCRVMVLEGSVSVRAPDGSSVDVGGDEMVEVTDAGIGPVQPIPPDGAGAGEWIDRNNAFDRAQGFAMLAFLSIVGAWEGFVEVEEDETGQSPPGTVRPIGVAFMEQCSGSNCSIVARADVIGVGIRTSPATWDGEEYTVVFEYPLEVDGCPFAYTLTWKLRPVAGPGGYIAGFTGTDVTVIVGTGDPATCFVGSAQLVSAISMSRSSATG